MSLETGRGYFVMSMCACVGVCILNLFPIFASEYNHVVVGCLSGLIVFRICLLTYSFVLANGCVCVNGCALVQLH